MGGMLDLVCRRSGTYDVTWFVGDRGWDGGMLDLEATNLLLGL